MRYSKVVTLQTGRGPTVGIVGLVHGDETAGQHVLDRLQNELELLRGTVKLIYANLPAWEEKKRFIECDLNRAFPGKKEGKLEERIAHDLRPVLASCDYVLDIHTTTLPHIPFVFSNGRKEGEGLVQKTGLGVHVIAPPEITMSGTLINFVNGSEKGVGISYEAGQHESLETEIVAMMVIHNVLQSFGMIAGEPIRQKMQTFRAEEFIDLPAPREDFTSYPLKNFRPLKRGTPYGRDKNGKEYSLDEDCYVLLYSHRLDNDQVFLKTKKIR